MITENIFYEQNMEFAHCLITNSRVRIGNA